MDTGPSAENGDGVPVWPLGVEPLPDWARPDRAGKECPSDRPPRHQALLRESLMEPSPDVHSAHPESGKKKHTIPQALNKTT